MRVQAEKAWEVSLVRRTCVALLTYLTASVFLYFRSDPNFLVMALIPTGGYLLSTLSLPWIKKQWMRKR